MTERSTATSMLNGMRLACPHCGKGRMFQSYLVVRPSCETCGEELHHQRADDAPAYFTMFIVGHIVIGLVLAAEQAFQPPLWLHMAIFLPMLLGLSLVLLPRIKGALIGLQWAQRMHGFAVAAGDKPGQAVP